MKTAFLADHPCGEPMIEERAGRRFEASRLTVAGLSIRCLEAGASGPAVVLLHGSGSDAAGVSLGSAMATLAACCRVFAPDLPGFGDSDPLPEGWGFAEYSAFLNLLLDGLGLERASLVGLSMGGGIALGFALDFPARVERLVLIDSACLGSTMKSWRLRWVIVHLPGLDALQWRILAGSRYAARWTLARAMPHRPQEVTPALVGEVMRLARTRASDAAFRRWLRREVGWRGLRTNYVDRLPRLAVPTLILHGADDPLVPVTDAERAHRLIADSHLEILADCGHMAPLEQPEAVGRALCRFLQPA